MVTQFEIEKPQASSEVVPSLGEWHDTDAIYARLHALLKLPPRPIPHDRMEKVLGYFESKCQRSKEMADRAAASSRGACNTILPSIIPFPWHSTKRRDRIFGTWMEIDTSIFSKPAGQPSSAPTMSRSAKSDRASSNLWTCYRPLSRV